MIDGLGYAPAIHTPWADRYWQVGEERFDTLKEAADSLVLSGQLSPEQPSLAAAAYRAADREWSQTNADDASLYREYCSEAEQAQQKSRRQLMGCSAAAVGAGLIGLSAGPMVGGVLALAAGGAALWNWAAMDQHGDHAENYRQRAGWAQDMADRHAEDELLIAGTLRKTDTGYLFENPEIKPVPIRTTAVLSEAQAPPALAVERSEGQVRYNGLSLPKKQGPA